jgi:hypothetical protein
MRDCFATCCLRWLLIEPIVKVAGIDRDRDQIRRYEISIFLTP